MKHTVSRKKIIFILCILCVAVLATACGFLFRDPKKDMLDSVGKYKEIAYYCTEGFQDFTKYGKYQYSKVNLDNHAKLKPVSQNDIDVLMGYIDNFEDWVACHNDKKLTEIYDFNRSVVDDADYLYLYTDPDYPQYGYYDIYFFDTQTKILYFFHSNI